jgi:hypothetical protein
MGVVVAQPTSITATIRIESSFSKIMAQTM